MTTYEEAFKSVSDLLDSVMTESNEAEVNNEEVVEESTRTVETKACKNALKEAKSNMKQAVTKLGSDPERALQLLNVAETKLDDAEAAFDRIPKEGIGGVIIVNILEGFKDYLKECIIIFAGNSAGKALNLKNDQIVIPGEGEDLNTVIDIPNSDAATKAAYKAIQVRRFVVSIKRIAGLITRFNDEGFSIDLFNSAKAEIKSSIKLSKAACKALEKVAMKSAKSDKSDKSVKESVNELKVKTYEALHENRLTQEAADDILLQLDLMLIQSNEL